MHELVHEVTGGTLACTPPTVASIFEVFSCCAAYICLAGHAQLWPAETFRCASSGGCMHTCSACRRTCGTWRLQAEERHQGRVVRMQAWTLPLLARTWARRRRLRCSSTRRGPQRTTDEPCRRPPASAPCSTVSKRSPRTSHHVKQYFGTVYVRMYMCTHACINVFSYSCYGFLVPVLCNLRCILQCWFLVVHTTTRSLHFFNNEKHPGLHVERGAAAVPM